MKEIKLVEWTLFGISLAWLRMCMWMHFDLTGMELCYFLSIGIAGLLVSSCALVAHMRRKQ